MLRERTDQFDLVMAGVHMPEMDIFKFIKCIQLIRDIPIILMSSKVKREMVGEAMKEGACFFLEKPVSKEQLKNVWQHVYRQRCHKINAQKADKKEIGNDDDEVDSHSKRIKEGDKVSKNSGGNNFLDNSNENVPTDVIREKNKQIMSDQVTPLEECVGESQFIISKNDQHGRSNRKRTYNDIVGRRNERTSIQNSSPDLNPIAQNGRERKDTDIGASEKILHMCWTLDLNHKFTEAIRGSGGKEPHPKQVLEMMDVPTLMQCQVANHMQKYRVQLQCFDDARETYPPLLQSKMAKSTSDFSCGNSSLQKWEQNDSMKLPQGPDNEIAAEAAQFIPPTSRGVNIVESIDDFETLNEELEYGDLSSSLGENSQSNNAKNFDGANMSSNGEIHPYHFNHYDGVHAASNVFHRNAIGKGKQSLGFEAGIANSSYVTPQLPFSSSHMYHSSDMLPDENQHLVFTTELDDPHTSKDPNSLSAMGYVSPNRTPNPKISPIDCTNVTQNPDATRGFSPQSNFPDPMKVLEGRAR